MEILLHIVSLVVFIIMAQKGLFLLLLLGISSIDITESTNISAAGNDFDLIMVNKKNKNYHRPQFTGSNKCPSTVVT